MLYNYIDIGRPLELTSTGKCETSSESWIHRKDCLTSFELIIVTEGILYLKVGPEHYEVSSGQCLVLQPNEENISAPCNHLEGYRPSKNTHYWMHFRCYHHSFRNDVTPNDFSSISHAIYLPCLWSIPQPERVLLLMRLLQDHRRSSNISTLDYGNYMATLIMCELYQQYCDQMKDFAGTATKKAAPNSTSKQLYNDLTDYIHFNMSKNIRIQDLSEYFTYSAKHLSHVCKQHSGLPLKSYILRTKIQQAQFLLLDSNSSIQEIAFSVGFSDGHTFAKAFKKETSMSPSEYRIRYSKRIQN